MNKQVSNEITRLIARQSNILKSLQIRLNQPEKSFKKIIEHWRIFNDRFKISEKEAISLLKKYNWFITPNMDVRVAFEVLSLDKKQELNAKKVNSIFINYFQYNNWTTLEDIVNTWKKNIFIKNRFKIIHDCFVLIKSNEKKNINPSNLIIPVLLSQIDGILNDYLAKKNIKKVHYSDKKKGLKNELSNKLVLDLSYPALDFLLNKLFQESTAGKQLTIPFYLNRHKILHGETLRFGRIEHSIRCFMIIDFLSNLE